MLSASPLEKQINKENYLEQEQIKAEATNYVLNNLDSRSASPLSGSSESPSPFNAQSNCSSPGLTATDATGHADKSAPSLFRHFQVSSSMSEIKDESKAATATVVKRHSKKLSKPKKYSQSDVSIESIKSPSGSAHSSISPRSITPSGGKHQQYQLHQQLLEQNQHQLQMQAAAHTTVSNSSPILNIESIINNMSSNMNQQHAYNYSRMQPQQSSADYASNKYHSNLRLVAAAAAAAAATNPMSQFGFGNQLGAHQQNNALLHHPFPIPAHAYFANVAKYAAAVASNNELMQQQQQQFAMSKSLKQQHEEEDEDEDYEDRQLNLEEDEDQINQAREELEEDSILNEPKHQEDNNDSSSTLGIDTSEEYLTSTNANNVANMSGNSSDTSMTAVKTNNQSSSSSSSSMSTSNNGLVCVVCGDISSGKHYGN